MHLSSLRCADWSSVENIQGRDLASVCHLLDGWCLQLGLIQLELFVLLNAAKPTSWQTGNCGIDSELWNHSWLGTDPTKLNHWIYSTKCAGYLNASVFDREASTQTLLIGLTMCTLQAKKSVTVWPLRLSASAKLHVETGHITPKLSCKVNRAHGCHMKSGYFPVLSG